MGRWSIPLRIRKPNEARYRAGVGHSAGGTWPPRSRINSISLRPEQPALRPLDSRRLGRESPPRLGHFLLLDRYQLLLLALLISPSLAPLLTALEFALVL